MEKINKMIAGAMVAGAVVWALDASASLINVGDSLGIYGGVNPSLSDTGYINDGQGGSSYDHVYAGALSVTVVDYSQQNQTFTIGTFCTDAGITWQSGSASSPVGYTATAFAGAAGIQPSWSVNPQAIQNASYLYNQYYIPAVNANTLTADQAAGLQLAIWKVLYDTAASGSVGGTSFSSGAKFLAYGFGNIAMNDAAGYITDVNTARSGGWNFSQYTDTWLKPNANNSQGLIWNNTTPVPEPTTMIAGALLLLPFGASTLRILRRRNP